ncbi:hypothetical protein B0J18DRAFT_439740 [Chaetomium sp. MPI-SDFR-AT-0129]|nr:hypothetical protein B0J18DRAFT_439740 [Chaetomium sp. MPI-SDFR-AT-0129]
MDQAEPLDGRDLVLAEYWRKEIDKSYTKARDRHLPPIPSTIDKCISNIQAALSPISAEIKARETPQLSNWLHQHTVLEQDSLSKKLAQDFVNKYGVDQIVSAPVGACRILREKIGATTENWQQPRSEQPSARATTRRATPRQTPQAVKVQRPGKVDKITARRGGKTGLGTRGNRALLSATTTRRNAAPGTARGVPGNSTKVL